jgi:hypothetical protein
MGGHPISSPGLGRSRWCVPDRHPWGVRSDWSAAYVSGQCAPKSGSSERCCIDGLALHSAEPEGDGQARGARWLPPHEFHQRERLARVQAACIGKDRSITPVLPSFVVLPVPEWPYGFDWRRRPESNWGWRFCRPLPYHLATSPRTSASILPSAPDDPARPLV